MQANQPNGTIETQEVPQNEEQMSSLLVGPRDLVLVGLNTVANAIVQAILEAIHEGLTELSQAQHNRTVGAIPTIPPLAQAGATGSNDAITEDDYTAPSVGGATK